MRNPQDFQRIKKKKDFYNEHKDLFDSWSQFETQIKFRFSNGLDKFNAVLKPSGLVYIDEMNYLRWLYENNRGATDGETTQNSQENPLSSSLVEGCSDAE